MEITIKSLKLATFYAIREVLGFYWCNERRDFCEDGIEVCDVSININNVKVEPDVDGVWLFIGERVYKLEREDFLEIVIF